MADETTQHIIETLGSLKRHDEEIRRALESIRKDMPDRQRCAEHGEALRDKASQRDLQRVEERQEAIEERVRKVELTQTRSAVMVAAIVFIIQTVGVIVMGIIVNRALGK